MTTDTATARVIAASPNDVDQIIQRQGEPQWLAIARRDAWRAYESMDLPDEYDEEWRRTDVRGLPLEGLAPISLAVTRSTT